MRLPPLTLCCVLCATIQSPFLSNVFQETLLCCSSASWKSPEKVKWFNLRLLPLVVYEFHCKFSRIELLLTLTKIRAHSNYVCIPTIVGALISFSHYIVRASYIIASHQRLVDFSNAIVSVAPYKNSSDFRNVQIQLRKSQ